jgi:hypothetical protein
LDCGSNYESSILSGHPISVAGSVNGKPPAFEAGFRGSIPRPAAIAGSFSGRIPGSDPGDVGSNPAPAARVSRGHRPKDRTVRYERTNRGSTPRARTNLRPVVQSHRTQRSERWNWGWNPHWSTKFRGVGRLVRHLIVDQGDAGSIPVHRAKVFRGCRLTAGSLDLTQRMRVQLSPALPRGCRLIGQDRCLSSSGCGIVTRRPYQVSGYKLSRRSTRLLIERAQFDSVMAHQVVPR